MKFQHIIQAVYFEPWQVTIPGWRSVDKIIQEHQRGQRKLEVIEDENKPLDIFGEEIPTMTIANGLAMIPVKGVLLQHAGLMEKMCGAASYDEISGWLDQATSNPAVHSIRLDIDSPGGMAMGCNEVSQQIADITDKGTPVMAFTDGWMCSAAYSLAAGANIVAATPSAQVGSIGTISAMVDSSLAHEMAGLKVEVFASGKFKGMGFPGTTLTEEQRSEIMAGVMAYDKIFKDHVRERRPGASEDTMQGQTFTGLQASKNGLVDLITTRGELTSWNWK